MTPEGGLKREPGDDRTAPEEPRPIKDLASAQGCPDPADLVFRLDCSLRDIRTFYAEVELNVPPGT